MSYLLLSQSSWRSNMWFWYSMTWWKWNHGSVTSAPFFEQIKLLKDITGYMSNLGSGFSRNNITKKGKEVDKNLAAFSPLPNLMKCANSIFSQFCRGFSRNNVTKNGEEVDKNLATFSHYPTWWNVPTAFSHNFGGSRACLSWFEEMPVEKSQQKFSHIFHTIWSWKYKEWNFLTIVEVVWLLLTLSKIRNIIYCVGIYLDVLISIFS